MFNWIFICPNNRQSEHKQSASWYQVATRTLTPKGTNRLKRAEHSKHSPKSTNCFSQFMASSIGTRQMEICHSNLCLVLCHQNNLFSLNRKKKDLCLVTTSSVVFFELCIYTWLHPIIKAFNQTLLIVTSGLQVPVITLFVHTQHLTPALQPRLTVWLLPEVRAVWTSSHYTQQSVRACQLKKRCVPKAKLASNSPHPGFY